MPTQNMAIPNRPLTFIEQANDLRSAIKGIAFRCKGFIERTKSAAAQQETDGIENISEMIANLTLSYRHLEDASMRFGKAIQAKDGGVSVYDKATTVGA